MTEDVLGMDEAMRLLRKTVANKGEGYVYERLALDESEAVRVGVDCVYIADGMPSCVVGHALVDFGVKPESIAPYNAKSAISLPQYAPVDDDAAQVFQCAQTVQDAGGTWGSALVEAEKKYRELGGTE